MSQINEENGFIISAISDEEMVCAVTCAYSIKIRNPSYKIALAVKDIDKVPKSIQEPFDYIVQFEYGCHDVTRANDWQLYWITPFKYNIVLDAHTLVQSDIGDLWSNLSNTYSIAFTTNIIDFKGLKHKKLSMLKDTELTYVDSSVWFFTADDEESLEYFKLADPMFRHWEAAIDMTIGKHNRKPYYVPDLMHSIVIDRCWNNNKFITDKFEVTSMQIAIEIFDRQITNCWTDYINHWVTNDTRLKIQNYNTSGIVNYVRPTVITQEIYEQYRNYFRLVTK